MFVCIGLLTSICGINMAPNRSGYSVDIVKLVLEPGMSCANHPAAQPLPSLLLLAQFAQFALVQLALSPLNKSLSSVCVSRHYPPLSIVKVTTQPTSSSVPLLEKAKTYNNPNNQQTAGVYLSMSFISSVGLIFRSMVSISY